MEKRECVCKSVNTQADKRTHTKCKKHLPLPALHPQQETETTQLAAPSLLCLLYVFTTQRQMVSWHCSTLMSLGGSAGGTFISTVLFQFTSQCTHKHRKRGRKKPPLYLIMEYSSWVDATVFQQCTQKVHRELKFSQFGTSEAKRRMTEMGGSRA